MVPFKEYRMSTFQVVLFSGIVMGCMLLAFYLGAYFGNKIGFENAMNENLENLAKVPIDLSDTGKDDVDEKTVNQVYEKLKQDSLNGDDDDSLPTLSNIINDDVDNKDKEKVDILNGDKVPNVLEKVEKKAVGDYVEDIEVNDNKDNKKIENIKKKDDEVKVVLGSIDDEDDNLKNEVAKIKLKADEEYEKSKAEVKEIKNKAKEDIKDSKDSLKLVDLENNKDKIKEEEKKVEAKKDLVVKKDVKDLQEQIIVNDEVKNVEVLKPLKLPVQNQPVKDNIIENKPIKEQVQNAQIDRRLDYPSTNGNKVLPKLPDGNVPSSNVLDDNMQNNVKNSLPSNQGEIGTVNQNNNQLGYQGAVDQGQRVVDSLPMNQKVNNSNIPRGYYVQIASTPNQMDANILSRKVRESGFKAVIEETIVGGSKYYRVLAGPEDTREHANRMAQQISREPYINSQPFVRDVK